jgi:hypothetical protein
MIKYCLLTIVIILSSCASWDKTDKILLGSYLVLSAVDALQATQIDGKNNHEANPILAKSDGKPDMLKVVGLKAASGLLLYFVADRIPRIRTELLVGANVIQGGIVIWNLYQF